MYKFSDKVLVTSIKVPSDTGFVVIRCPECKLLELLCSSYTPPDKGYVLTQTCLHCYSKQVVKMPEWTKDLKKWEI